MSHEQKDKRLTSVHLIRMKIDSFGAFSNKTIGPFKPQLNVVFGNNEAGKTTLNAFFGGVLFGWEDARGTKNTYKPKNADRSGSLFFEDEESGEEFEFSRQKNTDGLQGPSLLIDDMDKETFSTMFALTSDELRSLKNTTDVTAKLLTAGSGTSASPAQALGEIHAQIAEYTSRASGLEHSLVQLRQRQEELRSEIAEAGAEAERFKREDREFHELIPRKEEMQAKLDSLNKEIETLAGHKTVLKNLDLQEEEALEKREALFEEERELVAQHDLYDGGQYASLVKLSSSEENNLRDRLDIFFEAQAKEDHRMTIAKETYAESKAAYEALLEDDDVQELEAKARSQRKVQIALSVILPLVFVGAGVPSFIHGREIGSLSFTALGIGLVVFAVVLASAALVMLFRPSKTDEALAQRKSDARWVMLQDKKKLEACEEETQAHEAKVTRYLSEVGLEEAQGSLRRARKMLDEAKDDRVRSNLFVQRQQALVSQLSSAEETLANVAEKKKTISRQMALRGEVSLAAIEGQIAQKEQQRIALNESSASINRRYGELKQELSHAQYLTRFDDLKIAYQQICTKQEESARDYARLLLAKRMLESAIGAWESKSQPEVYRQASRLMSLMTNGKWVQIRMTPEGRLQVIDEVKNVREPLHLSLGTCQQLYLSLRVALLMTAENVGRIIPIMADDILVNFDEDRRAGAIRVLQELSTKRQVIIFTCHKEIVRLMQSLDSQTNVLEL